MKTLADLRDHKFDGKEYVTLVGGVLSFHVYENVAWGMAVYPDSVAFEYCTLGLVGEAGEVANKVKKILRGDASLEESKEAILDELGDVLWYISNLAGEMGYTLEEVAKKNIAKLALRKKHGTIKGSGDNR